jgi:hypothetical protein
MLIVTEHPDRWEVRQILDDPAGDHDWGFTADVDLAESNAAGYPVVTISEAGRL